VDLSNKNFFHQFHFNLITMQPSVFYDLSTISFYLIASACMGIGFLIGILARRTITAKYQKRILQLEEEMLKNHARILKLIGETTKVTNIEHPY